MIISNAMIEDNEDKCSNLVLQVGEFISHSTWKGYETMDYSG